MQFLLRFLQILSYPFLAVEFIFRFLSALNKSRKYVKNPDNYPADSRFKSVYILASRIRYFKGIKIIEKGIENIPKKKPVLFVANHKSNLDAIVLLNVINHHKEIESLVTFVAKKELLKKSVGKILRLIDCVFIDREMSRKAIEEAVAALEAQKNHIRSNVSLGIFSEGTRVPGDKLGEFKGASIKVAYKTFSQIIPAAIYGTEGKMDHSLASNGKPFNKIKGRKVYIEFLKPVMPINIMNIESNKLVANIRNDIQSAYLRLKKEHETPKSKKKDK
ncbi:lysophospholipid acyltransferase family protein [[Mycoplasma] testudinis]|uniref:lysophospholipid acyltransferase family protein n=1 Tax=[Mycoplasma] testudinis TaxID=33924 RepID=UPI0006985A21|nr:lysophospholipid acyltransferase family protein [[Mycoplasma] testudinis]